MSDPNPGWFGPHENWAAPEPRLPRFLLNNPPLTCELVPKTAWWSNVRSNVSRADWEKCKTYSKSKTAGVCIICGGVGDRWPTEAHEIWGYDDARKIQTLVDIWPLCTPCHQVKHLGRTRAVSNLQQWTRVIEHMLRVNRWDGALLEEYVDHVFDVWERRSRYEWTLDISFLDTIGVVVSQSERR